VSNRLRQNTKNAPLPSGAGGRYDGCRRLSGILHRRFGADNFIRHFSALNERWNLFDLEPPSRLLQEGLTLHRRGALSDAAALYAEVLRADPDHADAHYYLAMILCQQGVFKEGAAHAAKALQSDPRHARAHLLLGRSLSALGQGEEALACFDRAIAVAPELAQAHGNRGDALSDLGRNAEAVESYDRAVALAPGSVEDWFNRGVSLATLGRNGDAICSFDRAIAGKPDYTQAYLWRAKLLSQMLRNREALAAVDKAFMIEPGLPQAWVGRGNVLLALGRFDEALAAFDQALKMKPTLAEALIGCGKVNIALGRPELAVDAARRALECSETAQTKSFFAQCLGLDRLRADSDGGLRELALRALSQGWTHPRQLVQGCLSLVVLDQTVSECVTRADRAWPKRLLAPELFGETGLEILSHDALLRCLLESTPITDIGFERLLTNVRASMLASAENDVACNEPLLGFYCAVARQCYENDYVYSLDHGEADRAQRLRANVEQALAAGHPCSPLWPVVVGAYCPLYSLSNAEALLPRSWPRCMKALLVQQIEEPLQERRIAATIPAFTDIDGEVSRAVRQQYEENPYPRWVKAPLPGGHAELARRQLGEFSDILIAGCGTGLFTVTLAQLAPRARILAIDLSLASLSYAKRMASSLGLTNIAFAQADITKSAALERTFDFIDASGVLHHLADPWQGWRILLALLRPGGVMQVGLYSKVARQNVVAARTLIAARGYRSTPEDIRRCREEIFAADDGSLLKSITTFGDFFTTNECRDLIFHVQEHRVTLPEIKSFLAANGVQFTGFMLDAVALQRFAARFPETDALTDLDRWQAFEILAPETFAAMYRFTVRKPMPGSNEAGSQ
jgi:tetratricopeptide (TPR) repeat protein/SAM-dependent methyltransferase